MELSELRTRVDDLKLMLLSPKLFINKYFDDLINQLDIQTISFEIEGKNIKRFRSINGYSNYDTVNLSDYIDKINDWRQIIVDELKKVELEFLDRITPDFKLDIELTAQVENVIKIINVEFNNETYNVSTKKYNELFKKVNNYSFQMQEEIMGNQCFMVLSEYITKEIEWSKMKSLLWRNILPLIRINGAFIKKEHQQYFE